MKDDLTEDNPKLFEELAKSEGSQKILIRNKIFELNQRLVDKIVQKYKLKYQISDYESDEYKQEGLEELIKAIEDFNHELGNKFSTYAWIKIDGKIKDYILKYSGTIHIPKEKLQLIDKIKKAKSELEADLGYEVNYEDVWEIFQGEITREKFNQLIESINTKYIKSIDDFEQDQYDDDQEEEKTKARDTNFIEQENKIERQDQINEILKNFDEKEKLIFNMTFEANGNKKYTNKEIAKKLNLSPSSISRKMKRINLILDDLRFRDNMK